jgi:transcriptional regulator with XRE-family HTH domain
MFASRLKNARKEANLTLEQLAKIYNSRFNGKISRGTLSKYENGKQEPMIFVVKNLSQILNVSADYLLGTADDEKIPDSVLDDVLVELLAELSDLTEEERAKVSAFIQGLKANR